MSPRVPPEIVDVILENLDTTTLLDCSLVTHMWADLTRRYLFKSFTYRYFLESNPDDDTGETIQKRPTLRHLVAFLREKTYICTCIRQLRLLLEDGGPRSDGTSNVLTVVKLFQNLPNLERLHVEGLPIRTVKVEKPLRLYKTIIPCLKEFSIVLPHGTPWVCDFIQLLQLFGEVESLIFRQCPLRPGKRSKIDRLYASRTTSQVHSVTFEDTSLFYSDCLPLFTRAAMRNLQRVELPTLEDSCIPHVASLLAQTQHSLRHLRLDVHAYTLGTFGGTLAHLRPSDLGALGALESVALVLPAYDSRGLDFTRGTMFSVPVFLGAAYTLVVRVLAALAPTLRAVTLELDFAYKTRALDRLWRAMQTDLTELEDVLLARDLRQVTVRDVTGASMAPEDQRHFRKALRRLLGRGILHIV